LPTDATGVTGWRRLHPSFDGRGVLIAILDSGVDLGAAGLQLTTTGQPKVLDVRDFSGEGDVALSRVRADASGRIALEGGLVLRGAAALRGVAIDTVWYGGVLEELPFGPAPDADFNGNGSNRDRYGIVVVRGASGWVALVDTDADLALDDETPRADFLVRRETFTFSWPGVPRGREPITAALNLGEDASVGPRLSVFLDNSSHGTHVSGIAAGHRIGGADGLDGVAPGAQLIALKISNNARGGVSTNGSMLRAMEYAARFAAERRLPLVMNMSFGVGNEREGHAAIDSVVNAFLLDHPEVVFTIAAGNDGPGTSTLGLPGSAELAITVGAFYPGVYSLVQFGAPSGDLLGWWSSRGGELAKPDLLAPGIVYSTVPRWNTGNEIKLGTSMATPHVAGIAALLVSAAVQEGRPVLAADLVGALRATALPMGQHPQVDQGYGVPAVEAAWQRLRSVAASPRFLVEVLGPLGPPRPPGIMLGGTGPDVPPSRRPVRPQAAYRRDGLASPGDTIERFRVSMAPVPAARRRLEPLTYRLTTAAPWLRTTAPTVRLDSMTRSAVIEVRYDYQRLRTPGRHVAAVYGAPDGDSAAGPAFSLLNTVVTAPAPAPAPATASANADVATLRVYGRELSGGEAARHYIRLSPGTSGFAARISLPDTVSEARLFVFEPSGRPARGGHQAEVGGSAGREAVLRVLSEHALPGVWELVVQAMPGRKLAYSLEVLASPAAIERIDSAPGGVALSLRSASSRDTTLVVWADRIGVRSDWRARIDRGQAYRREIALPRWATRAEVEVAMRPEQWDALTDFAMTLFDGSGERIGNKPMNYAVEILEVDLPRQRAAAGEVMTLELFPGFALPTVPDSFDVEVRVSLLGPDSAAAPAGRSEVRLRPGAGAEVRFAVPAPYEGAGEGWSRLLRVRVAGRLDDWARMERHLAVPAR
jgi:subtilisin family serine protease